MSRLNQLAADLYPRWWRERYGAEFSALLNDARPSFRSTLDIFRGALIMQLTTPNWVKVLCLSGLFGLLLASGVVYSMKDQYISEARFYVNGANGDAVGAFRTLPQDGPSDAAVQYAIDRLQLHEQYIARTPNLSEEERNALPLAETVQELRKQISVVPDGIDISGIQYYAVRANFPDPFLSKRIATEITVWYMDQMQREVARLRHARGIVDPQEVHGFRSSFAVIRPVSVNPLRVAPDRIGVLVAGIGIGACCGSVLLLISRWKRGGQPPPMPPLSPIAI